MSEISFKRIGGSIIRNITIKAADEKELEFVQGLHSLGMNGNVARLVTYLKNVKEGSAKDIETATGMKQSAISIATQKLRKKGWITERSVKPEDKGRPRTVYALRLTIDEILKYYEMKKTEEFAQNIETIKQLKKLSSAEP